MTGQALWDVIRTDLPAFLDRQRWYSDKLRPIQRLVPVDCFEVKMQDGLLALFLVRIEYEIGEARTYFIPVVVDHDESANNGSITTVTLDGRERRVQDAITTPEFRRFLLDMSRGTELTSESGAFAFEPWTLHGEPFRVSPDINSESAILEQSNSSVTYGHLAVAKIYRRLEFGQNIEIEMSRFFTSVEFPSVPRLIGSAGYVSSEGQRAVLVVQQHVGEHRDCWSELTEQLRARNPRSIDLVEGLGRLTGDMHVALASSPESASFNTEIITEQDVQRWISLLNTSLRDTEWAVGERKSVLPDRSRRAAEHFLESDRALESRAGGYLHLVGLNKTRVHGDYHLGQVLITATGNLFVVDFEGEPQRPVSERRAKYSPLKDVAGMLRSLGYAAGIVSSTLDVEQDAANREWLPKWQRDARETFVNAYRNAANASNATIIPEDDESFDLALQAWETDKALYEVRYELNSRPDWAWLPLDALTP